LSRRGDDVPVTPRLLELTVREAAVAFVLAVGIAAVVAVLVWVGWRR
jgi:hypothetical protein